MRFELEPGAAVAGGAVAGCASTKAFVADHMSVYRTDPAAQKAIWARVDRLIRRSIS